MVGYKQTMTPMYFINPCTMTSNAKSRCNVVPEDPIKNHKKQLEIEQKKKNNQIQFFNGNIRYPDIFVMGCCGSKNVQQPPGYENPVVLAAETNFSVSEVEALYELYKKLSNSLFHDGLIHKEEFQLALFRSPHKENLFADRVFDVFDKKHNGVIEFGEFVRSLSAFHPDASQEEKIEFAFKVYDLRQTGFIEREEVKQMLIALLDESDISLLDEAIETILDMTFKEADKNGDGKIDKDEWREFVLRNPSLLRNMSLSYLKNITIAFPSFIFKSEVDEIASE